MTLFLDLLPITLTCQYFEVGRQGRLSLCSLYGQYVWRLCKLVVAKTDDLEMLMGISFDTRTLFSNGFLSYSNILCYILHPFTLKGSIHMPRIGYQGHSEWYTVERLLRKYASLYGIKIFVYSSSLPCFHSHDPHRL